MDSFALILQYAMVTVLLLLFGHVLHGGTISRDRTRVDAGYSVQWLQTATSPL